MYLGLRLTLLLYVCPVDLMLEQQQRERHLADVRLRLEREKGLVELKLSPQKRQEAAAGEMLYMKPVMDKHGKTIERPTRPL